MNRGHSAALQSAQGDSPGSGESLGLVPAGN